MDEQRLSDLLRAAADDPPPAGFSHADVVDESSRLTRRRRRVVAGGATGVLGVVLSGGLVAGVLASSQANRDSTSAAGVAPPASAPEAQSDALSGRAAPAAPPYDAGRQGCPADPALSAAVVAALPDSADRPVTPVQVPCGAAARGAEVALPNGTVRVVLDPVDSTTTLPAGARSRTVRTASGQSLTVSAIATPAGPGPDDAALRRIADELASRY